MPQTIHGISSSFDLRPIDMKIVFASEHIEVGRVNSKVLEETSGSLSFTSSNRALLGSLSSFITNTRHLSGVSGRASHLTKRVHSSSSSMLLIVEEDTFHTCSHRKLIFEVQSLRVERFSLLAEQTILPPLFLARVAFFFISLSSFSISFGSLNVIFQNKKPFHFFFLFFRYYFLFLHLSNDQLNVIQVI